MAGRAHRWEEKPIWGWEDALLSSYLSCSIAGLRVLPESMRPRREASAAKAQEISIRFSCSCSWVSESWGMSTSPSLRGTTFCMLQERKEAGVMFGSRLLQNTRTCFLNNRLVTTPWLASQQDRRSIAKRETWRGLFYVQQTFCLAFRNLRPWLQLTGKAISFKMKLFATRCLLSWPCMCKDSFILQPNFQTIKSFFRSC